MSSSIVLDASAAVDFVSRRGPKGDWVADHVAKVDSIHAPHLVDFEVTSALRGLVLAGRLPAAAGKDALLDFAEIPVDRYPAAPFLERMWELRNQIAPYDAAYVALAEALEVPLVTTDAGLASAGGHRAEILAYGA